MTQRLQFDFRILKKSCNFAVSEMREVYSEGGTDF